MSEPVRICLVGATGLIGWEMIEQAVMRRDVRIIAIARRAVALPKGARMELVVSETVGWGKAIAFARANVLVCALGTTWRKADKQEAAFCAVDRDLVLACARDARAAGIDRMIVVSSVGAEAASNNRYLRVKGEMETALGKLGFRRLDILRPGLLRGARGELRLGESVATWLSPLSDVLLHGSYRKYRSIRAAAMARAIFALAREKAGGRFVHEHDELLYALRRGGG